MSTKLVDRLNYLIVGGVVAFFLGLLFLISYFGLPLSDESFPIATALRFVEGQRPFVDDFSPYIGIGLVLAPIIKLSLWLHQGRDELILFLRHCYILFVFFLSVELFFSTRSYLSPLLAFFVSVLAATFHPFGINNFHYDTLAQFLWTIIIFQLYLFLSTPGNKYHQYFIFSCLNAVLCLVYPTFSIFLLSFYILYHFILKDKKKFWFSHILIGGLVAIFLLWLFFGYFIVKPSDMVKAAHFSQALFSLSTHDKSFFYKLYLLLYQILQEYGKEIFCYCFAIGIAYWLRNIRLVFVFLLMFVLLVPLWNSNLIQAGYVDSFHFYNSIGFLGAIIFLFFYRENAAERKLFYYIFVPSLFAGLLTGATSYNLQLNFIIGFFPAALLGFLFLYKISSEYTGNNQIKKMILLYAFLLTAFFQANYIYGVNARGIAIYQDLKPFLLKGPFLNLYIEPYQQIFLTQLQKDLQIIDTDSNKYIYFGPVSSGYLLIKHLKPGDYLLYCPYDKSHFTQKIRLPSYTFDLTRLLNLPEEEIYKYFAGVPHKKILTRQYYNLYYAS